MEHAIEYLEAELDSLKDAWREDTQGLRDVYISRIIDIKEALCHLKKISERQESTNHSDSTEQNGNDFIADVSNSYFERLCECGYKMSEKDITEMDSEPGNSYDYYTCPKCNKTVDCDF